MERTPVLFIGHGSPMNAIEENEFSQKWTELGKTLAKPAAVLCISAHWYTHGTRVNNAQEPRMIYDMYGFLDELYRVRYPAPGSPQTAGKIEELLGSAVQVDNSWGIDHGTWSVLRRIFPGADVPLLQLSVNADAASEEHFAFGRMLRPLREQGVMIVGSGNIVHNLARVDWRMQGGYDWADEFDLYIRDAILAGNSEDVVHCERAGAAAKYAFTTPDHFLPLLYTLGAAYESDKIDIFCEKRMSGGLSMTSYRFS